MAFGFIAWLFLLFVKGNFSSNNVSSSLTPSSTSFPLFSTTTTSISKSHNHVSSSSILQSSPSATMSSNSKGAFHRSVTTKSTLLPTSRSSNTLVSSLSGSHGLHNKTQSFSPSSLAVNPSLASNVSTPVLSINSTNTTERTTSSPTRESLLSGQLAGVALILFILVVLLLIICLGNFADEPVFNERELFTEEVSMKNLAKDGENQGEPSEDEEWKFDPLFAWSPRKSFDSKL